MINNSPYAVSYLRGKAGTLRPSLVSFSLLVLLLAPPRRYTYYHYHYNYYIIIILVINIYLAPGRPAAVGLSAWLGEAVRGCPGPGGRAEGEARGRGLPSAAGDEARLRVRVTRVREVRQCAESLA